MTKHLKKMQQNAHYNCKFMYQMSFSNNTTQNLFHNTGCKRHTTYAAYPLSWVKLCLLVTHTELVRYPFASIYSTSTIRQEQLKAGHLYLAALICIVHLYGLWSFEIKQSCYSTGLIYSAVDGNWTVWGDWELCSVTCGGGAQSRSRTCTNPPPRYGGRDCTGDSNDVRSCNDHPCPSK